MLSRLLSSTSKLNNSVRYYSTETVAESKRVADVTTLPNGLKVVSLNGGYNGPASALGIYINTGSRFESNANTGANHVLKNLLLSSNHAKFNLEVQRELEIIGPNTFTSVGRDNLLIGSEVIQPLSLQMLNSLANITNPTLQYHEVRDTTELSAEESNSLSGDVVTQLFESLHKQAYRGRTLGRPLVAPTQDLHHLETETVVELADQVYNPSNMILVSVGLNHKELVNEATRLKFGRKSSNKAATSTSAALPKETAKYVGGDDLTHASGNTHTMVAFEGSSLKNVKDVVATAVLQSILGGGSLSPMTSVGQGRTSRLFNLLQKNSDNLVKSDTFNIYYQDTGLFGVYTESKNGNVTQIVSDLVKEIVAASKSQGQELEKAKNITKAFFLNQLSERRLDSLKFVGKQALYNDKVYTPEEYVEEISKVTAEDIKRVASKLLNSKPTLVVRGDITDVPTIDQVIAFKN